MATLAIITASIFALVNGRRGGYERPFRNIEYGSNGGGYVEGFVTHGVNNYNGERIVDLISTGFGQSWDTPIYEQQVLNTNGPNAELITASTDRNTELAMGRFFTDALGSVGSITPNEDLFNQPYYDVGTITQSSLSIDDRSIPISFDNIPSDPSIAFGNSYLPDSVNPNPTLAEWEEGSGLIEIDCNNGIADVTISVCNLLPEALYTVWEVGISNPGPNEAAYWYPAGGLGNVIRTDENGNGELNINMPWCPVRECIPDSSTDCQIYFSVFHHNDYIVWGGDAAGLFWKPISYPAGIVGSNHLWFPLFGENLQDPLNRYNPNGQCRRNSRGERGRGYRGMPDLLNNDAVEGINDNTVNIEISRTLMMFIGGLMIGILLLNIVLCYNNIMNKKKNVVYGRVKYVDSESEYAPHEKRAIKQ